MTRALRRARPALAVALVAGLAGGGAAQDDVCANAPAEALAVRAQVSGIVAGIDDLLAQLEPRIAELEDAVAARRATPQDYETLDALLEQSDTAQAERARALDLAAQLCRLADAPEGAVR